MDEDKLDDFSMTLALPSMFELGCRNSKTLSLINACIPRGSAIYLANKIPDDVENPVLLLSLNQHTKQLVL